MKRPFCVYCKRKSHLVENCWKVKKQKKKHSQRNGHGSENAACVVTFNNYEEEFLNSHSVNVWIFDGKASAHTTNKTLFLGGTTECEVKGREMM